MGSFLKRLFWNNYFIKLLFCLFELIFAFHLNKRIIIIFRRRVELCCRSNCVNVYIYTFAERVL